MKTIIYFIAVLWVILNSSCKKFVGVDVPIHKVVSSSVFLDDKTATSAILGLYSRMASTTGTFSDGATTLYLGVASDELKYLGSAAEINSFYTNVVGAGNSYVYDYYWADPYKIIYQANACLEGLQASSKVTPSLHKQLMGEAYFVRAFCYWYLLNFFGDVPLNLTTNYELNAVMARTSAVEVNSQIIDDLQKARAMLSKSYPTAGKLRPNYFTATALLSRVYLFNENWKASEGTATEIITSGLYSLEKDINRCFLISSSEAIWQLAIPDVQIINTIEGNRFIPTNSAATLPNYEIMSGLLSAFETGDLRRTSWIGSKTVGGVTYNYPYKYKVRSSTGAKMEHCIIFRLAELYLNRAEARVHLNNIEGASADLNMIRDRASLPSISVTGVSTILKEKRVEYFAEWGMRWFDLKRTGELDQIMSAAKTTWISTAKLFPIPSAEIQVNPNLTQNKGY